jgi:hypothetical protein
LNEREFLYSLCEEALERDKSIRFAAVVNHDGKLIVGTSKRCIIQQNEILDNDFFKSCLNNAYHIFSNDDYGQNSLINKKNIIYSNLFERSDFQLIHINKNMFIAFVPITENQDKYLCLYFESGISLHKTLLNFNTIFEYNE